MKSSFLFSLLAGVFLPCQLFCQNLVANPSFEHAAVFIPHAPNSSLPEDFQWWESNPTSADMFGPKNGTAPQSSYGYLKAHHGYSYIGLVVVNEGLSFYTERIQSELLHPLVKGEDYFISFYVSLADNAQRETSQIELGFTKRKSFEQLFFSRLTVKKAVSVPKNVYPPDTGWLLVSGIYTAKGNERFVNLGNFSSRLDKRIRRHQTSGTPATTHAYYLFDDISVIRIPEDFGTDKKDSFQLEDLRWISNSPAEGDSVPLSRLSFRAGETEISDASAKELDVLIDYLRGNPFITGHLELQQPEKTADAKLNLKRERELEQYFYDKGISSNRVHFKWKEGADGRGGACFRIPGGIIKREFSDANY